MLGHTWNNVYNSALTFFKWVKTISNSWLLNVTCIHSTRNLWDICTPQRLRSAHNLQDNHGLWCHWLWFSMWFCRQKESLHQTAYLCRSLLPWFDMKTIFLQPGLYYYSTFPKGCQCNWSVHHKLKQTVKEDHTYYRNIYLTGCHG